MKLFNLAALGVTGIVGIVVALVCCVVSSIMAAVLWGKKSTAGNTSGGNGSGNGGPTTNRSPSPGTTGGGSGSGLTQVLGPVGGSSPSGPSPGPAGSRGVTGPAGSSPAPAAVTNTTIVVNNSSTSAVVSTSPAPAFRYHNTDPGSFLLVKADTAAMALFADSGPLRPGATLQLGGLQTAKGFFDMTRYDADYQAAVRRVNEERPVITILGVQSVDTYAVRVRFSPATLRLPEHCTVTSGNMNVAAASAGARTPASAPAASLFPPGAAPPVTSPSPAMAMATAVFRYHNTYRGMFVIPKTDSATIDMFRGPQVALRPGTSVKLRGLQVAKAAGDATRSDPAYLAAVASVNQAEPVITIKAVPDLDQFSVGVSYEPATLQLPEHCLVTQGLVVPTPPPSPPASPPAAAAAGPSAGATYRFRIHNTGWAGRFLIPVAYHNDLALFEGANAPLRAGVRVRLSEFRTAKFSSDPTINDPSYVAQIAAANAAAPVIQLSGQVTSIDAFSKLVSYTPTTVALPEHVTVRADVVP